MEIRDLVIEVTRNCNFACSYCLRGEPENVNIDIGKLKHFIERNEIDFIGSITFTGGEPGLNTKGLNDILDYLIASNIDVGNFFIATNGSVQTIDFIGFIARMYAYCTENEITCLKISNHYDRPGNVNIFKCFSFTDFQKNDYGKDVGFISEGRSAGASNRYPKPSQDEEDLYLYFNVLGEIYNGCDYSYESQRTEAVKHADIQNIKVCDYNDNLETKLEEHFNLLEEEV